ncbi:hypothetical protein GEMRC1_003332 [Eukaryota sp. GEM-RC1]
MVKSIVCISVRHNDFSKTLEYPLFTKVINVLEDVDCAALSRKTIAAVLVNNQVYSLHDRIDINCTLVPVGFDTEIGAAIYRRSLCFLLAMASSQLWPERRLIISHSIGHSLYYYFETSEATTSDVQALKTKMKELIDLSLPMKRMTLSFDDALSHFKEAGLQQTLSLLQHKNNPRIHVNVCGESIDLWYSPLVENTSYLSAFELEKYQEGLIVRYPASSEPNKVAPFIDNPVLYKVYKEHNIWGRCLDVHCVGALNDTILEGKVQDFIHVAESLHDGKTARIADKVPESCKLICICGPSSSGKTTFSHKLGIALQARGWKPITMALDDYYVPRKDTPLDEDGNYDFEQPDALDLPSIE